MAGSIQATESAAAVAAKAEASPAKHEIEEWVECAAASESKPGTKQVVKLATAKPVNAECVAEESAITQIRRQPKRTTDVVGQCCSATCAI